jgi:hypothetical protein
MLKKLSVAIFSVVLAAGVTVAADDFGLEEGNLELQSAGPLAFGLDGVLFIGDPQAATLYALQTGTNGKTAADLSYNVKSLDKQLAAAAGTDAVKVVDMAVNPAGGEVIFSVTAGESPALIRLTTAGKFSKIDTEGVAMSKLALPNPPADKVTGEGRRARNNRLDSITDIAYLNGRVLVSGLSAEAAPSTVREIEFPFKEADPGVSLEIYHAAHGRSEDNSAVRTFVPFNINGEPNVLAGFTCTPLVKFPIKQLTGDAKKVTGTTIAELGNRNKPLDMIVYEQDGKQFLLMANSARGVMKISTEDMEREKGLTTPVSGGKTAGQEYETIESLAGVTQLDKLSETQALVVTESDGGLTLSTVDLP